MLHHMNERAVPWQFTGVKDTMWGHKEKNERNWEQQIMRCFKVIWKQKHLKIVLNRSMQYGKKMDIRQKGLEKDLTKLLSKIT